MTLPSTDPALPNFSRVAAVIADPTRARMLAALLCGEYRSAGELATVAGITPQAASTQLAQLVDASLVAVRQQGRHKYFALADAEVATLAACGWQDWDRPCPTKQPAVLPTPAWTGQSENTIWRASWHGRCLSTIWQRIGCAASPVQGRST